MGVSKSLERCISGEESKCEDEVQLLPIVFMQPWRE